MKLVNEFNTEMKVGDKVSCFRGSEWTLTGWSEPHKISSSGRVYVQRGESTAEFFPPVVGLKFIDEESDKLNRILEEPEAHGLKFPE